MPRIMRTLLLLVLFFPLFACAERQILNIYAWTNEIPDSIIRQFEKESGIKVNISTYENNEIMFAKLRASEKSGYDIVMPSSYFVDRMQKQNLLEPLDKTKLPNLKNLSATFMHPAFDKDLTYSIPYIWGVTGIFYNDQYYKPEDVSKWSDLWRPEFKNKLMLLDDTREIFSMALLADHYSANDSNPENLERAFNKLKTLSNNIKVFSTETVVSIMIDEDANIGMAWNGDAYKAAQENPHVKFIFPDDGFVIWVDNLSIARSAPHKDAAYKFLNFILRADVAEKIAAATNFAITNEAGKDLLPEKLKNDPMIYPSKETLRRGQFQVDINSEALSQIEGYWEEFKMQG